MHYCLNSIPSLLSAQKKFIRATDSEYHNYFYDKQKRKLPSHTKAIFNIIGILALPNLIAKSCVTLMNKVYMGVAPSSIETVYLKSQRLDKRKGEFHSILKLSSTDYASLIITSLT